MISVLWKTTGSLPRWGPPAWAGRSGWTEWKSPSSPTSSKPGASVSTPFPWKSPTVSNESPCIFRKKRACMIFSGMTGITYGDVHRKGEWENSVYCFELADVEMLLKMFDLCEQESIRCQPEKPCASGLRLLSQVLPPLQHPGRAGSDQRCSRGPSTSSESEI